MGKLASKLSGVLLAIVMALGICGASFLLPGAASPAYAAEGTTVLTFTSDIHNASNDTAANRLDSWFDKIKDIYGDIDVMSFCGDMGSASANESQFWTYTQSVMDVVDNEGIEGVYTTGNHEFYNGQYSSTTNAVKGKYLIGAEGAVGDNYRIYCMGTANWNNNQDNFTTDQITALSNYLNSVSADRPIIVLVHFPLHRYSSRSTTNADKVIDALNAAANEGKKIVVLWGHNHTMSDSNYDQIFVPGENIAYNSSGSTKEIQFYYGAAGCMSDREYGTGSEYVKGKGLVITVNDKKQLSFAYYDANANNVTENGSGGAGTALTEQDPVPAEGISVSPTALEVEVGRSGKLAVTFTPSDTTNKGVTWTSSDTGVATVTNGKVKGVSEGTATITATSVDGGFTATCEVSVLPRTSADPYYVIKVGDYVLSTERSTDESNGGSSGGSWGWGSTNTYTGLVAVEDSPAAGTDEETRWIIEETDGGYYIKSLDGRYLNATYTSSGSTWNSSSTSDLKLDDTPDVWVLDSGATLDTWEVDGSYLQSTNSARYLCEETGTAGTHLISVRSKDNADKTTIEEATDPVAVSGVTVSPETATVEAHKTVQLTATVLPENATNKTVLWSSSDTGIATVSASGKVRGVAEGTATITATTEDGSKTATAEITVTPSTSTDETHYVITIGGYALGTDRSPNTAQGGNESYTYTGLSGVAYDADSVDDSISWIFEEADGGYYIKSLDGKYLNATYDYTSSSGKGDLKLDDTPDVWTFDAGYSIEDTPINGSYLKSTNASETASSDKYLGYEDGDANLFTVRSKDNADTVTVDEAGALQPQDDPPVNTTVDITPSTSNPEESATIKVGETLTINVTNGSTRSDYDFTASLGNSDVAQVQGNSTVTIAASGTGQFTVKGIAAGTVDITIQNENSSSSQYTRKGIIHLTVVQSGDSVAVTGVTLNKETATLAVGRAETLTATVTPDNATNKNVTWESDNTEVATVDGDGKVTAVAEGTATITATTEDGGFSATCAVTVTASTDSRFELVDALEDGGEYLIVNANSGSAYALKNPGGSSSGTNIANSSYKTAVTVESGDYILTGDTDVVWTATANGDGFNLTNNGDYLEGASRNVSVFNPQTNPARYWTYNSSRYLQHNGGTSTYTLRYSSSNGYFQGSTSNTSAVYLFKKVDQAAGEDPVESVALNKSETSLTVGKTEQLTATVLPSTAADKSVTWTSSDESVATVDADGKVTAVAAGTATITVKTNDGGFEATCTVEVVEPDPIVGKTYVLTDTLEDGKNYVIASTNEAGDTRILGHDGETAKAYDATIASDGGKLKITTDADGVAFGAATITGGFSLINDGYYMTVEGSGTLQFATGSSTKYWNYSDDNKLSCASSSATRYLTFSNGEFAGYYSSSNPKPSNIYLFVEDDGAQPDVAVTSVTLDKETAALTVGETETLVAIVEPDNATNKNVTWSSSDEAVATVDENGVVTAVAAGEATITVTTEDGEKTATCALTVNSVEVTYIFTGFTWTEDYTAVANYTGSDSSTKTVDAQVNSEVTTPATCESEGLKTYTASVAADDSPDKNAHSDQKTQAIAALGHEYVDVVTEPTCTEPGFTTHTCSRCGDSYKTDEVEAIGHSEEILEAVEPTCTEPGLTEGKKCSVCGVTLVAQEPVAALGHAAETVPAVAPACTETGLTEGSKCSRCGETLVEQQEIAALGHLEETLPAVEPTCTETGLTEGKKCSRCGEVLAAQEEVAALGHDFGEWVTTKAPTCTETGIETRTCSRCNETETNEIPALNHTWGEGVVTTPATCEGPGEVTQTCSVCGETQTAAIDPLGHEWNEPTYTWNEDENGGYESLTAERTCARDANHVERETVKAKVTKTVPATDEEEGKVTYASAEFDNPAFRARDIDVRIPALGHDLDYDNVEFSWTGSDDEGYVADKATVKCKKDDGYSVTAEAETTVQTTAATCTEDGKTVYTATAVFEGGVFTETKEVTIAATGHVEAEPVRENVEQPTCTKAGGYDEVVYCAICGVELSRETQSVEALGHDYADVVTAPTCTEAGFTTHTCTRCGDTYADSETDALGHDFGEWKATKAATCTEDGAETRTCSRCDVSETRAVEALGHDYTDVVTAPTCTEAGFTTHTCTRCGNSYVDSETPATGHTEVTLEAVEPTCTEPGLTEGKKCSVCGVTLVAQEPVAALGHAAETVPAVAPNCTETGLTEGSKCSRCGETLVEQQEIAALGHVEEVLPAVAATCTDAGLTEGKKCSRCGETLVAQEEIAALGHDWNEPTYTWNKNANGYYESLTASRTCTSDASHVEEETVEVEVTKEVAATDEAEGLIAYTCGEFKNSAFKSRDIDVIIPALGHDLDYDNVEFNWTGSDDEGYAADQATVKCKKDDGYSVTAEAVTTAQTTAATCTEDGKTVYTATAVFEGGAFTDAKEVTIAAVGHTEEVVPAVAPTCTATGKTEGKKCSTCGEILVAQETVPALGHSWDAGEVTKQPAVGVKGIKTFTCKTCGATRTESIPALEPTDQSSDPKKMGEDGTAFGPGASAAAAEAAITNQASDADPAGSTFSKLKLVSKKQSKSAVNISWSKVKGAAKYVVYGNQCGKKNKMQKIATVASSKVSKTFKKVAGKKVKAGKSYKFLVVALDKNGMVVSSSKVVHAYTKGGKYTNHKSVTVKKGSKVVKAVTVKKGKTVTLKAVGVKASAKLKYKNHTKNGGMRYESTNTKIATVSAKGVVKGKAAGTCYVYVYSQNGVAKKVKVTVK